MHDIFIIDKLLEVIDKFAGGNVALFSKKSGIKRETINSWKNGSQPTKEKIQKLSKYTGQPEDYFYTPEDYPEIPEQIGTPTHDSDRGSYGLPDLSHQVVKKTIEADFYQEFNHCVDLLAGIFKSGETSTIAAIKSNLEEFHEKVKERVTMKQEIEELRNDLANLKKHIPQEKVIKVKKKQKGGAAG